MDSLRLGDADREAATELLSEHYALGRLTKEEFDERSDAVWSAKTRGDLVPVFADLPAHSPAAPVWAEQRPPWGHRRFPVAPVLFVLVALTVVTHLPFVVAGLVLWLCLGRHRPWGGHRHRGSATPL